MAKPIEKDGFKVEILPGKLRVGSLEFSASEASKITGLLSFAGQMAAMPGLPPSIGHAPFEIAFSNTGIHFLHREGTPGGVEFKFEQLDALVAIINHGVDAHKNQLEVQKTSRLAARGRMTSGVNAPDIIEGRG